MATTVGDTIQAVRFLLDGGHRGTFNFANGSGTAVQNTIVMTDSIASLIDAGDIIEVGDEQMLVRVVSNQTLTVKRGWAGTTAATWADGATVSVNPSMPASAIRRMIGEEIASISPTLFQVATAEVSTQAGVLFYPITLGSTLNALMYRFLRAEIGPVTGDTSAAWAAAVARPVGDLNTTVVPSGFGVLLAVDPASERTLRVSYGCKFDTSVMTDATTFATIGLSDDWSDIIQYGVAARMAVAREARRSQLSTLTSQRTVTDVPVQANLQAGQGFRTLRSQRLSEEANKLLIRFPYRMTF